MNSEIRFTPAKIAKDFLAGLIVFLVALPLCLGIAIGSGADPMSGLIAGIVGGIVIGIFSGSHTSVSGPAAGLTAIVASQINQLGAFETFLLAVMLAGVLQVLLGLFKAGALSAFFPSAVIKGLLAAIGIILILGQFPLLLGFQKDLRGSGPATAALSDSSNLTVDPAIDPTSPNESGEDQSPLPSDAEPTDETEQESPVFGLDGLGSDGQGLDGQRLDAHGPDAHDSHGHEVGEQIFKFLRDMQATFQYDDGIQWGSLLIGLISLAFLIVWDQIKALKKSLVPSPLLVVILGSVLGVVFTSMNLGGGWNLDPNHYVFVPSAANLQEVVGFIRMPDFSQLANSAVYVAAITIAIVASLETLLNLDAVDKLDKKQRVSPPNRELFAQGLGNISCGLLGGLPVTSVVIRGSVNVSAGAESKLSAIIHGFLLLGCVLSIPWVLNMIPLSCLAAILLMTGYKLASPALFQAMAREGRYQFLPFLLTVSAIILTDLLIGVIIGLVMSLLFILHSNLRRPVRKIHEKHIDGELLHIELNNQVSFLNRAALESAMREAPVGSRLLLDARRTDYIDPDVLNLIREFREKTAPAHNIQMELIGFKDRYRFTDREDTVDYSIIEARECLTPDQVLDVLREGNKRFVEGHPIDHDLRPNRTNGEISQPIAAFYTGIDSKTPVEMLFDLGIGDAYVVRMPGAVYGPRALGGLEYAASVGGVKVIVVMGRLDSELLVLAAQNACSPENKAARAGCANLEEVLDEIAVSMDPSEAARYGQMSVSEQHAFVDHVARTNIRRTVRLMLENSDSLRQLVAAGKLKVTGAMLESKTGSATFFD